MRSAIFDCVEDPRTSEAKDPLLRGPARVAGAGQAEKTLSLHRETVSPACRCLMDPAEYTNLEQVEEKHWFYAGKREIARRWLLRVKPPRMEDVLLDCGAGTGRFAQEMGGHCRVLVLDDHEEALRLLRARFAPEQVLSLENGEVPLPDRSADFITALDVLEHVEADSATVEGFARLLKPGGVALVTVPASMALWSDWDEHLHHFRRYRRRQLAALFPERDWEILHLNYANVLTYPIVWLVRRWRMLFPPRPGLRRPEDRIPPRWLNRLLRASFVAPAFWPIRFPVGVSLLLVARRR